MAKQSPVQSVWQGAYALRVRMRSAKGELIMAALVPVLGFFLIYPILLILILSFNESQYIWFGERVWGFENWRYAWEQPRIFEALGNTVMIWALVVGISFPIATIIAWGLARTNIPFSHGFEVMFWVSFMMPGLATTLAWMTLLDPRIGLINKVLELLPFVQEGPFNIFSVPGIVWAHLMANGISTKVMLLTPAFRNMDATMEEAARVSGASNFATLVRVTLPVMISPMVLIFSLQMLRIFSGFEIEFLLGIPIGFYVYSTLIVQMIQQNAPPLYGEATVLASLTLLAVAVVIPLQRWVVSRRRYTTITGAFRPGLIDLRQWRFVAFGGMTALIAGLTVLPFLTLVVGSFMNRAGYFNINPVFSLEHWRFVLADNLFWVGLQTTLTISVVAAFGSPLLFVLIAYILVRTRWRGRVLLDFIIWGSAAIPGVLSGLGLLMIFLGTPGLSFPLRQPMGVDHRRRARRKHDRGEPQQGSNPAGRSGDRRGSFRLRGGMDENVLPNHDSDSDADAHLARDDELHLSRRATSTVILLASRETMTLSLVALEYVAVSPSLYEEANIMGIFMMTFTTVLVLLARWRGLKMSVRHG